jgi:two-component system response regulator AtoC
MASGGADRTSDTTVRDVADRAPRADLLLVAGNGRLATYELSREENVIGRGAECDVIVDDGTLSRRHAVLRLGPPPTIQDLGSKNGTHTAGVSRVGGDAVPLAEGEGFRIGPFAFVLVARTDRGERSVSARELLRVVDPTPDGVPKLVRDIARDQVNALVLGETGVGKEVLASTLHLLSNREGPLTRINCATLGENLLESELFGHEKGAFTGATSLKVGLIESSNRGTVFLDEIGELSLGLQAKLLRVLEQREVMRIGSTKPIAVDVRFVAATNRDLPAEVAAGRFRRDLFFRLDGITLQIPPLRERRPLLGPLAIALHDQARERAGKPKRPLSADVLAALEAHDWPGNVRELKATLERAVLLAGDGDVARRHLVFSRTVEQAAEPTRAAIPEPRAAREIVDDAPDDLTAEQREDRQRVMRALDECAGNQTRAAQKLGISRTTLVTKLRVYRIPRPRT